MRDDATAPAPRVAFVGLLGGDAEGGRNAAYSAAGAQFQERLIRALGAAGMPIDHVFAVRPIEAFPRRRTLWLPERRGAEIAGVDATLVPFANLGPVKPLSVGAALVPRLVRWARARRGGDMPRPLIVIYNVQNPPGFAAVIAARLGGARAVAVLADMQVPGSGLVADSWPRRLEFALQRWALTRLDGLVLLTHRMSADFAPRVPWMLMEGAAPDEQLVAPDAAAGAALESAVEGPEDRFTLMYAGGLNDLKGVPALLDAFARLRGPRYRLWITGTGPLRGAVEAAAAADPRIRYWGFPPYHEVLALYARASLLVNPHSCSHASARYLFPSKLIEYLATGTPVVSTVSAPEVASEYGSVLIAAAGDGGEALARAVASAESMPAVNRAALGARARAHVLRHKSWAAQGARVADFLADVATRPGRR